MSRFYNLTVHTSVSNRIRKIISCSASHKFPNTGHVDKSTVMRSDIGHVQLLEIIPTFIPPTNTSSGESRPQHLHCESAQYLSTVHIRGITSGTTLDFLRTSAFWAPPNSANTAATLFPLASLMAPSRFPAYPPITRPGTLAVMKPKPAPHAAPSQAHRGR